MGLLEADQIPTDLVVVDDYSGTGKTFIKTVNKMFQIKNLAKDIHFHFLTLHITHIAVQQIEEYAKTVGIIIDIISLDCSDEAFKKNYIYGEIEAEQKKRYYMELCNKYAIEECILGFEDVASLVAFHYNTPNNTLKIGGADKILDTLTP